jgi:hypothetical protein
VQAGGAERILSKPLTVVSAKLVADGSVGTHYTNYNLTGAAAGITTNLNVVSIQDGQTVWVSIFPNTGLGVTIQVDGNTVPAAWFLDGAVTTILTNGFNEILVRRDGGTTNVTVYNSGYSLLGDSGCITLVTNYITGTVTITDSCISGSSALDNLNLWTNLSSAGVIIPNPSYTFRAGWCQDC